ncbi:MAG: hypothetical protein AAFY17_05230 [Cyanobacteria bacterium J06642_11]
MQSIFWMVVALMMIVLGYRLYRQDEVYAIALYILGIISGLWGFSLLPSTVQLTMGVIAIGWLQLSSLRN